MSVAAARLDFRCSSNIWSELCRVHSKVRCVSEFASSETPDYEKHIIGQHAIKLFKMLSGRNTFVLGVLVILAFSESAAGE
jgi:hypothetical protein